VAFRSMVFSQRIARGVYLDGSTIERASATLHALIVAGVAQGQLLGDGEAPSIEQGDPYLTAG